MMTPEHLSQLYQQACEVELQAFKPGNVSVYAEGHDMTVADFRISAQQSAAALCKPEYSLGEKIYYAVKATREAVGCNTNLGILLLCAPLVQAAGLALAQTSLRAALQQVLNHTTQDDADWVFKAITLAAPGGLGRAEAQDVAEKPTVNLQEAMRLASGKDRIALQYVSDYRDIFDFSLLIYYNTMSKWGNQEWAAVAVFSHFFSQFPDSHIERKYGDRYTNQVAEMMSQLSDALAKADNPKHLLPLLYSTDKLLKDKGINPGTMADLTVATVFTVFLEDALNCLRNKNLPIA